MSLSKINEFRISIGLKPLTGDPNKLAKQRRQDANRAARAQACRDLKSARSSGRKAK